MDRQTRSIAAEILDDIAVSVAHDVHRCYRVAKVYQDGLTDKEMKFLMARHLALEEEMQKLSKLKKRLINHG